MGRLLRSILACALLPPAVGCSLQRLALGEITDTLSVAAKAFAREDDPELVRASLPVVLESLEALVLKDPHDPSLRESAAAAFTHFAGAFVMRDARAVGEEDFERAQALRERGLRLLLRARDHALAGLETLYPGIADELRKDPRHAVRRLGEADVALAYWTAGAWGLAISAGRDRPELLADTEAVRQLLLRALELDEDWGEGALHEAMIVIEGLPPAMGGSPKRAREHFHRAVELCGDTRAAPYVSLARSVSLPAQNRAEFEELLLRALEIDLDAAPDSRLANRLAQDEAHRLLERTDELFLD